MLVDRAALQRKLGFVSVALGKSGFGACFIFRDGYVTAFNEDMACRAEVDIGWEGIVQARPVLALMDAWRESAIEIKYDGKGRLIFGAGKNAKSRVPVEEDDRFEGTGFTFPDKRSWKPLDPRFLEGLDAVKHCASNASKDEFFTRCIHITPRYIEATDLRQYARFVCETPISEDVLVMRDAVPSIMQLGVDRVSEGNGTLCFRNSIGVDVAVRTNMDDYPDSREILRDIDHPEIPLPGGVSEVMTACKIFAGDDGVRVQISGKFLTMSAFDAGAGEIIQRVPLSGEIEGSYDFHCAVPLLEEIITYGRIRVCPHPNNPDVQRIVVRDKGFVFMVVSSTPEGEGAGESKEEGGEDETEDLEGYDEPAYSSISDDDEVPF